MGIGKRMGAALISKELIKIQDLCFQRDWQVILHNFNLEVSGGEFVLLKGKNGSGKTTLLKLLLGLLSPLAGKVEIFGNHSYLGHQNGIKSYLTLSQFLKSLPSSELKNSALLLISQLKLSPYVDVPFSELSAGLKRRFALIQLLTPSADIYIVDEPFDYLDQESTQVVWKLFQTKIKEGACCIITHHGVIPSHLRLREVNLDV